MFTLALNTSALFAYIYRAGGFMSSGLTTTLVTDTFIGNLTRLSSTTDALKLEVVFFVKTIHIVVVTSYRLSYPPKTRTHGTGRRV